MSAWWERGEEIFARGDAYRNRTIGECRQHVWRKDRTGGVCVTCGETVSEEEL